MRLFSVQGLLVESSPDDSDTGCRTRREEDHESRTHGRLCGRRNDGRYVRGARRRRDDARGRRRSRGVLARADGVATVTVQVVAVVALLGGVVRDAVSAARRNAVGATRRIRLIGVIGSPTVATFGLGLHNAVAALRKRNPATGVVAVIGAHTVAVITLLPERRLHDAVAAVTDFVPAQARAAVVVASVAVVALFTEFHASVAAHRLNERELTNGVARGTLCPVLRAEVTLLKGTLDDAVAAVRGRTRGREGVVRRTE